MVVTVPQNKEISGGGKEGGKKKLVLPSVGEERIGINIKNESEEESFREMSTPT